jgi:hypothetical protein
MDVKIGAEAALFPEKEYISWIFVAVQTDISCTVGCTLYNVQASSGIDSKE